VVGTPGKVWGALEPVVQRAVLAFSAQMLGAAERTFELATDYAKQRVQFGKPIASFMSIQHYLAQMVINSTAVETLLYYAAWNLDQGLPARAEVARTKLAAGNAAAWGTEKGAEIYGGMGWVKEVDMSHYLRRGRQWSLSMGDERFWQGRLIDVVMSKVEA
jgi:alkylation response protein AidB-like acyl-CoA dehydrogenase